MSWLESYIKKFPEVRGTTFFYFNNILCYVEGLFSWKLVSEMTPEEINQLTLIEMSKNMILLDLDDCSKEGLEERVQYLNKMDISYEVYETNRGYHIHIFVDDLHTYSNTDIVEIRKNVIELFDADPCKAHGGMFAIPERPHFKTGKFVKLIKQDGKGQNKKLPEAFYKIKRKAEPTNITSWDQNTDCPLFDYCCNNKLKPNTGRGLTLFKNMSAYLVEKYPLEEARKQFKRLCDKQEIYQHHWIDYQLQKKQKLSCGEIRRWLKKTQYREVEEFTCWKCQNGRK